MTKKKFRFIRWSYPCFWRKRKKSYFWHMITTMSGRCPSSLIVERLHYIKLRTANAISSSGGWTATEEKQKTKNILRDELTKSLQDYMDLYLLNLFCIVYSFAHFPSLTLRFLQSNTLKLLHSFVLTLLHISSCTLIYFYILTLWLWLLHPYNRIPRYPHNLNFLHFYTLTLWNSHLLYVDTLTLDIIIILHFHTLTLFNS